MSKNKIKGILQIDKQSFPLFCKIIDEMDSVEIWVENGEKVIQIGNSLFLLKIVDWESRYK